MCCSGPDVPDPDPNVGEAQKQLADLAVRQQNWYETNIAPKVLDQLDQSLVISKQQADKNAEMQDYQKGLTEKYDQRYWNTQVPLEDQLISEAKAYNTEGERERMAGEAAADNSQAFANSQAQLGRGLRSMGVNTGSAAAISAMTDMQTTRALSEVNARNKTREAARQLGWTKLGEAAALGRGLPSFGATSAGLSGAAGSAALGAGTAGLGATGTAAGIGNSAATTAGGLYSSSGQLGVANYNAQVNAANVSAQNDPFNTILGAAAGVGTSWALGKFSDRRLKTDVRLIGVRDDGLGVYSYRYVWGGPTQVGVMADEVRGVYPHAVARIGGYDAVDYAALGGK